jgi:hypothetical protein
MQRKRSEEPEHELQRLVDLAQFGVGQPPDTATESRDVERADLVHQHPRPAPGEFDLRPESRRHGLCRRRDDYDCRECCEFVSLNDDGIAASALFMTSPFP